MHLSREAWSVLGMSLFLAFQAAAAEVISVFPQGSVKQIQQVTVRFSSDMVALGDPKSHLNPFRLNCAAPNSSRSKGAASQIPKSASRWADPRNWVLDFDQPLSAGVQCSLRLEAVRDLAGHPVTGLNEYTFSTSGPAIVSWSPRYGKIEPDQYFVLQLDGKVERSSVEKTAFFEVARYPDKVPVALVEGKEREAVLKAAVGQNWEWESLRSQLKENPKLNLADVFANFIVVKGKRRFPENSRVVLHWPKGILSRTGLAVTEPQNFEFEVIPDFQVEFNCERSAPERPCNPVTNMRLEWSRSVSFQELKNVKLVANSGKIWTPEEFSPSGAASNGKNQETSSLTFRGPFPEKMSFQIQIPKGLKDGLGRGLKNEDKFPLKVSTDEYVPLVKFAANFGILELHAEPALPVSLRNVEKQLPQNTLSIEGKTLALSGQDPRKVIEWYNAVQKKDMRWEERGSSIFKGKEGSKIVLPKPGGARDFELVGLPLPKPGFYVVELESPKLGAALLGGGPMYVASSALVTNLAVHLKKGRETSLVWVTTLDKAQPVEGAEVSLFNSEGLSLAKGKTGPGGLLNLDPIPDPCKQEGATAMGEMDEYPSRNCEIFVFAKKGDDFSFTSSLWSRGIEDYRFNLRREYLAPNWGPVIAHTIFDQPLLRAGETIHMKHVLREHSGTGLRWLNPKVLPKQVLIVHNGSRKVYSFPFAYDSSTGTALTDFAVPKDANLGVYSVYLSNRAQAQAGPSTSSEINQQDGEAFDWSAQSTGTFMVSEYRLPLMTAKVQIQGTKLVQPSEAKVDLAAHYLSGGPAQNLKVKVRASLGFALFNPEIPGASEYTFFSEPLKPGVQHFDEKPSQTKETQFLHLQDVQLDENGGAVASIPKLPLVKKLTQLNVEMEYRDPNGEVKTATHQKTLYPANSIVGLGAESWIATPGKVQAQGIVTDTAGRPQARKSYFVEAFKTSFITHRKRLVGGFYSYDYRSEVQALGKVCEGQTDELGRFKCEAPNLPSGSVTLQAQTKDEKGRATYASVSVEVFSEQGLSWWVPSDSDRIDVLPEKIRYEPNEKAKLVVRTPFPVATALVTVEREGVLSAFTQEIRREQPTVEIPLKGHYAPNVFVSVLLIRGRVGEPTATALLDLARPAMKLGMTELKVGWKAHELKVDVRTDRKRYTARDKAEVTVQVKSALGKPLPPGTEVAVVALDEALLSLRSNYSWNLLEAMMGQRGLEVDTSSAQNQVIGRRHFGAKAKPPGGGGGLMNSDSRELFQPLLAWAPRLKVDAKGEVKLSVPLNDSMTSFRIAAMAISGPELFGAGTTRIESSKDLMILSGFAPVVREGDLVQSAFTVRNTTAAPMQIELELSSSPSLKLPSLPPFELKPHQAKTFQVPLTVPAGVASLETQIRAKDSKSSAQDVLTSRTQVLPAVPVQVQQATLVQLEKIFELPLQQPKTAIPGRGDVQIHAKASLVGSLSGVRSYMAEYPYSCLEQQLSKAIVLDQTDVIRKLILNLPNFMDSAGLLKFFTSSRCGDEQLTRYVLNILQVNGHSIPAETRDRLLEGVKAALRNDVLCPGYWKNALANSYRDQARVLLMDALSRYGQFEAAQLSSVTLTPTLWKTETVLALYQLLKRETSLPKRDELLKQTENILRAKLNFQGSLMNFQNDLDWEAQWRLFTSVDQEALRLMEVALSEPGWSDDAGRMARGILARMKKGTWDTTMANAWGVTVLKLFSQQYEKSAVTGTTAISVAGSQKDSFNWKQTPTGGEKTLAWPSGSESQPVSVRVDHQGSGKPWLHILTRSAIPLKAPVDLGYKVVRKVTPVSQSKPGTWSRGDVANIELLITAKTDQAWVVVRDPIPAGASHLGSGLDGDSQILDRDTSDPKKARADVKLWPSEFDEKSQSFFTSYAAYLPKGSYRLSYRIRLNSEGEFHLPPTRVEALYARETFGETPIENWKVSP